MMGEARLLAVDVPLPEGVTLRTVTDEADVRAMSAMADEAFGDPVSDERAESLLHRLALDDGMELWVAEAGRADGERRAARTGAAHRGRRHLGRVAPSTRGGGAASTGRSPRPAPARPCGSGKTVIHSDSTEFSRPILERSGFVKVSTTTPYTWRR